MFLTRMQRPLVDNFAFFHYPCASYCIDCVKRKYYATGKKHVDIQV